MVESGEWKQTTMNEKRDKTVHRPVLLKEVIEGLDLGEGETVLDGTVGGGGHSRAICQAIGKTGRLIALDVDKNAISKAKETIRGCPCCFDLVLENFRNLDKVLDSLGVDKVDKILLDLGFSSDQVENSGRGISFAKDEPLLMTLRTDCQEKDLTAREIVNQWDEENIADIIYGYGGEQFSRRIAKAIVEARQIKPIDTTLQLVDIIETAVPNFYKKKKIHFATKTFQALRITVNDEIGALKQGLAIAWDRVSNGGRMAVISFHEIEDRIVKHFFKEKKEVGVALLVNKKPIMAKKEEVIENRRSRSAKLRIVIKRI